MNTAKDVVWQMWRIIRWPIGAVALLLLAIFLYELARVPGTTKATVEAIHSQKITMADVDGSNLPPVPDPALVDATVEGIDANGNGIRDDVELAIFAKYPNDRKVRAAALQYAKAEQRFLTDVINTPTWKAAAEELSRATACLAETEMDYAGYVALTEYVRGLLNNTVSRTDAYERAYKYITSHGKASGESCDV